MEPLSSELSAPAEPTTTVTALSSQYEADLLGIPGDPVRLSWRVTSTDPSARQLGYELQSSATLDFGDAVTGRDETPLSIAILDPGAPLVSREVRHYRVRLNTASGLTDWSPVLTLEAGLLEPADWSAVAISVDSVASGPSPIFRHEFTLADAPVRARLYATSLGLNELTINGAPVAPEHLNPGWTAYHSRLLVATHDVTALMTAGVNTIGAALGDGWYRGRLGWEDNNSNYGPDLAVLAQLELEFADGRVERLGTDGSWLASFGEVRSSGIYDGTDTDFSLAQPGWNTTGFDATAWMPVRELPLDRTHLEPRFAPPVREVASFAMTVTTDAKPTTGSRTTTANTVVLDAGQNIAGWVRLVVRGTAGDTVVVRHAEVLEPDGSLHTRSLRSARAADHYVLAHDGEISLEPSFTFHGFRYADVVTTAEFVSATAVAISSDTAQRGHFESSDPALNRLHSNVVWSQRDNFVSVPTDCPQRDERLGWTGDAQAFAATANTLFATDTFWRSWLRDLELDQSADGSVASVVPNILSDEAFRLDDEPVSIMGRAGWADAATIVPWSLYESFGSTEGLERQLGSMRRWVDHLDARRAGADLLPTEFQFGDWLDPDAPGGAPWAAKVSADFVANAFFAHSARILADTERLVGDPERALHYAALGDEIADSTWRAWGAEAVTTQTGGAIALEFAIAPAHLRDGIADALARNVRDERGRIATGFLGTPLVLHALSHAGRFDEAYLMLLRRELPSWLYQVDMGATTVWERWDALRADGSIHPGDMDNNEGAHMLSFNHYAYGAVIDWVYRTLAGLAPDATAPGYRSAIVAPRPVAGIDRVSASIDTGLGLLAIDWRVQDDGSFEATLAVPFGATASVTAPVTAASVVTLGGALVGSEFEVTHGIHTITVTAARIASAHAHAIAG